MFKRDILYYIVLFCFCYPVLTQEAIVYGYGEANSHQGALLEAMRDALQKFWGLTLTSETVMQNLVIQKDEIRVQINGDIAGWEILQESSHKNLYRIYLQCRIREKKSQENSLLVLQKNFEKMSWYVQVRVPSNNATLLKGAEKLKLRTLQKLQESAFDVKMLEYDKIKNLIPKEIPVEKGSFTEFLLNNPAEIMLDLKLEDNFVTGVACDMKGTPYAFIEQKMEKLVISDIVALMIGDILDQLKNKIHRYEVDFFNFSMEQQTQIRRLFCRLSELTFVIKQQEGNDFLRITLCSNSKNLAMAISNALRLENIPFSSRKEHGCVLMFTK